MVHNLLLGSKIAHGSAVTEPAREQVHVLLLLTCERKWLNQVRDFYMAFSAHVSQASLAGTAVLRNRNPACSGLTSEAAVISKQRHDPVASRHRKLLWGIGHDLQALFLTNIVKR